MLRNGEEKRSGALEWSCTTGGGPKGYQTRRSDVTFSRYPSNEITVSFGSLIGYHVLLLLIGTAGAFLI